LAAGNPGQKDAASGAPGGPALDVSDEPQKPNS
jgi:hypothetical protein